MEFTNSLTGYVKTTDLSKETFDKIMSKIGCNYTMYEEDGVDYYKFTYERPNHMSMCHGTAAKLDFRGVTDEDIDLVANQLKHTVDNLV